MNAHFEREYSDCKGDETVEEESECCDREVRSEAATWVEVDRAGTPQYNVPINTSLSGASRDA